MKPILMVLAYWLSILPYNYLIANRRSNRKSVFTIELEDHKKRIKKKLRKYKKSKFKKRKFYREKKYSLKGSSPKDKRFSDQRSIRRMFRNM